MVTESVREFSNCTVPDLSDLSDLAIAPQYPMIPIEVDDVIKIQRSMCLRLCAMLLPFCIVLSLIISSLYKSRTYLNSLAETEHKTTCPKQPCDVSIAFMGDSVMRFKHYSLGYYLHRGAWIDPESVPDLVQPQDFLGDEMKSFWYSWYNASTSALAPFEICDCYRAPGLYKKTVVENRYYHDPNRNNTVLYIQSFGNSVPLRGTWDVGRVVNAGLGAEGDAARTDFTKIKLGPRRMAAPFRWSHDWPGAIRGQVAKARPEYLVLNAGIWPNDFGKPEFVAAIVAAVKDAKIHHTVWGTTTASRGGRIEGRVRKIDELMCQIKTYWPHSCLDVLTWTARLDKKYYPDQFHFV